MISDFGLDSMCTDDDGYTPFHYAIMGGHFSIVRMLVSQHSTDLNDNNDSPLQLAARNGYTNVMKAFINDFSYNPNEKGFKGRTYILHRACR